jgi:hypothetical protein
LEERKQLRGDLALPNHGFDSSGSGWKSSSPDLWEELPSGIINPPNLQIPSRKRGHTPRHFCAGVSVFYLRFL